MKSNLTSYLSIISLLLISSSLMQAQYPGWSIYSRSNSGIGSDTTLSVVIDEQNNFWFAQAFAASKFDGQNWTVYNYSNSPIGTSWNYIIERIDDIIYVGNVYGIYKLDANQWTQISSIYPTALKKDAFNNLWIATGNGLVKYSADTFYTYTTANSILRSNSITDLDVDSLQNLWVSTLGGAVKIKDTSWTVYYSQNSGIMNDYLTTVAVDPHNNVWFGGDTIRLYKYDHLNWTLMYSQLNSNSVIELDVDSSENAWFAVTNNLGLYKYDGTDVHNLLTSNSGLPDDIVLTVTVDKDNNKWIGTMNKTAKYDDAFRLFLSAPNGGENLRSLTNYNITWNYQFVETIRIDLTTDGGNTWNIISDNIAAQNQVYQWTIPVVAPQSHLCKIKISDAVNQTVLDTSDNYFTIYAKVNTPDISPNSGTYANNQIISISTTTQGASIYYTLDGSEPTQSSNLYTGNIILNFSAQVKAKAFKDEWLNSDTRTMNYQFKVADPVFQPLPGTYQLPTSIIISTITDSEMIFYTLDGLDPTQNSTLYTEPVLIYHTATLKARAYKSGYTQSNIKTGQYVISEQVIIPIITAENIWLDTDYNASETRQVSGAASTISYGNIISFTWFVNGDSVGTGPQINIDLGTGTSEIKLKLVGDEGVTAELTKEVSVYCAVLQTSGEIIAGVGQMDDNTFFVTSTDDKIYKFDSLGISNWTILTGGAIQSTTCISISNNIYVGSSDTRLYCFDAAGTPKWDKAMGGVIVSSPSAGSDNTIYVGVSTGRFFAVSENSTVLWNIQTGGSIESSPSIDSDGQIYIGSSDTKLYSITPGGQTTWQYSTGGAIVSSPAIAEDSTIIFGSADGKLYKLRKDGTLKWVYDTGNSINSSPVILEEGKIIFGNSSGKVFCINSDGSLEWELLTSAPILSSPAISSSGNIFIGNNAGLLLVLNISGEELWSLKTGSEIKSPVLVSDNSLIMMGNSAGKVFILRDPSASKMLLNHQWPTFKGNNRRTGNKAGIPTEVDNNDKTPDSYFVFQNYPNPFNPSTKIKYAIPSASHVDIRIFDILGNELETIVDEEKPIGTYELNWNAENLPSGIYFYRIQAGSFIETKKMILVK